jgi:predicted ferric reductase
MFTVFSHIGFYYIFNNFTMECVMLRLTLLLVLLWLPSFVVMGIDRVDSFFAWRHQLILLTGFLGLGYMCLAVLLAARFSWIESQVKGLDKGYKLHKKLGIAATISLIAHWLVVKSAKWLISAELIARPNRSRPVIEGINWHGIAEQMGDISFKLFLIFTIISLVQAISYKKFRLIHKIAGLLVLAGIFHSAFLLDWNIQSLPMNLAVTLLSVIAICCSRLSLTGKIGKDKKASGRITSVDRFRDPAGQNMVARLTIQLDADISYREAQFAYLDFHDGEPAHPFSVLNYDPETKQIQFAVKDLGDYTNKLVNDLQSEQDVTVEGGYGCFQISEFKHQVWVGAGIGIVPFISRLYWLQHKAAKQQLEFKKIDLFYCVNCKKEAFFANEIITILSKLSFIKLHILDAAKGELLNSKQITEIMEGENFDVSFCGPAAFAEQLQADLKLEGVAKDNFHRELFKMR